MPTLTIRNVDADVKQKLRMRAARHGRSIEAELREILKKAVDDTAAEWEPNLAEAIRRRLLPLGGLDDLEPHPPVPVREPPDFDR
jgi:plasmid stability protein